MHLNLGELIDEFCGLVTDSRVEVYNEESVRCHLANHLASRLTGTWKVELERNTSYFGLFGSGLLKSEMDIVVYSPDRTEKHCIELKFPVNGQYPEQMFLVCKDVAFLEQLTTAGFDRCYFVMFADDHLLYGDKGGKPIYDMFRLRKVITGDVTKPTGAKDQELHIAGQYPILWRQLKGPLRCFILEIDLSHGKP